MKNRLPLILILAIGVLTPVLSTALFFLWTPREHTHAGVVLAPEPPRAAQWTRPDGAPFDTAQWAGKWVLVFAAGGDCGAQCRKHLCQTRQLHRMLHGHYFRVERAWLVTDTTPPPARITQKTDCGEADSPQGRAVDTLEMVDIIYGGSDDLPDAGGGLHALDPNGIWAMRWDATTSIYDIRGDMKRLLRLSRGHKKIKP